MSRFTKAAPKAETVKQVRLKLRHIDVISALKVGFMVSLALAIGTIIGSLLLWLVLSSTGLFGSLGSLFGSILGENGAVDLAAEFSIGRVLSASVTLSLVNIVFTTALAAVWAAIFNLISRIIGGVAVTFTNN